MKTFYIFLDIDGVLATTKQFYTNKSKYDPIYKSYYFDKRCVEIFNEVINQFNDVNFKVILTSDWRLSYSLDELNYIFRVNNIGISVRDTTSDYFDYENMYFTKEILRSNRINEILDYMLEHSIDDNYIIIDDIDLRNAYFDYPYFLHTKKADEGLKQLNIKEKFIKAIKMQLDK